jgi:hypothetical protein
MLISAPPISLQPSPHLSATPSTNEKEIAMEETTTVMNSQTRETSVISKKTKNSSGTKAQLSKKIVTRKRKRVEVEQTIMIQPGLAIRRKRHVDSEEMKTEFYQVEKIRSVRFSYVAGTSPKPHLHKSIKQYLVQWKGLEEKYNTWETEEVLQEVPELIRAFETEGRRTRSKTHFPH